MTETLRIPPFTSRTKVDWGGWRYYLSLSLIVNAAIWGMAFVYLQSAPRKYTSNWMVALPRAGEQANVNVPGIGSAASSIQSPYNSNSADPREDYRYIAGSKPVLEVAANSLNMSSGEFGNPRIKIIDNTTLMQFEFEGDNPEEAQLKSKAFYTVLTNRLDELRVQEAARKQERLQATLAASQQKLSNAQKRLANYKSRSEFSSDRQVEQLASNIEELRKEQVQALAQLEQNNAQINQLAVNLQLSPQQVIEAFSLQVDPSFQQVWSAYGQSNATLVDLTSKYTSNNPAVINEKVKQGSIQAALLERSQYLLRKPVSLDYVEQLSLNSSNNGSSRQQLFQNLVSIHTDRQGLQARVQEAGQQMTMLEKRLEVLAKDQLVVRELQRDVQIAEAIFTSTLAQLDLRDGDVFGSYPQIQLVEEPSLPTSADKPNRKFVLVSTLLGSIFLTLGVVSLWYRKHKVSPKVEPKYSKATPSPTK